MTKELWLYAPERSEENTIKHIVHHWLHQQAAQYFDTHLPRYAHALGVTYQSITLSAATTRWGSCTSDGRIRLNWQLIHLAPTLIDYVIVHELAHRLEMNHSSHFWNIVQSIYPDYKTARMQLRKTAHQILPNF